MGVTTLLVKESTRKALLDAEKKPSKMEDNEWVDLDVRAKATIILCLSDEVLYNIMNKKIIAGSLSWRVSTRRRVYPTNCSRRSSYIVFG